MIALQRVAGVLLVIELDHRQRRRRRRVAQVALLGVEQLPAVRAVVTRHAVALPRRQLPLGLRVTLAARDVGVVALERHGRVARRVVIELLVALLRRPRGVEVAAIAAQQRRPQRAVGLVLVAAAAGVVGAEVRAQALAVGALVAVVARHRGVLARELPAGQPVIERLGAADRAPAHQIEAAAAVLLVAQLAVAAGGLGRGVEALAGVDARLQVAVIVTAQALRGADRAIGLVAGVAAVGVVERRVALRQRARRRGQEVVAARDADAHDHQRGDQQPAAPAHRPAPIPNDTSCA